MNFKKNILLTGAGFTANFGGPLAREMWSKILSNPKIVNAPEIRSLLLKKFDFEQVYAEVLGSSTLSPDSKALFQSIVSEAYNDMDETLKSYVYGGFNQYGCYWSGITSFRNLFNGVQGEVGAHFTLNQDILLERTGSAMPLGITAVKYKEYWNSFTSKQIQTDQKLTLYTQSELEEFKEKHLSSAGSLYYIKLHGSHGWQSQMNGNQMIIGNNKMEDIEREPILKWYFELFQEAVNRDGVRLFIIGYSFRDQHINEMLIRAVNEHKLKLYIISPEDPESLKNRLEGKIPNGIYDQSPNIELWKAINGYFPYRLAEIFPLDQTVTQISKNLTSLLNT